ncbi:MAG: ribosome assembly RNA-binding protein YhbY [Bdellovibrionales bacterium]|nr:ribosome assembly RNA-binding protein YhbY [Bdellovibrionales bacterium]
MKQLTSAQRKHLRGLAHHLDPIVMVGQKGITPELIAEVSRALSDHELIKVRFTDYKDQRKVLSEQIAAESEGSIAGIIGNHLILYKEHPDKDKRQIELPS